MYCPFCDHASLDLVWSSGQCLAFADRFPVSRGHTLIIPRRHVVTWFEASRDEQIDLLDAIDALKRQLDASLIPKPDGYNVGINAGEAAGQTVMHLHVHLIPRYHGDMDDPRGGVRHVIPSKGNYLATGAAAPAQEVPQLIPGLDSPMRPHLLRDLDGAVQMDIAVAFVFPAGLTNTGMLGRLRDMLAREGSRLRLLTGDYQDVTDPDALNMLLTLAEQTRAGEELRGSVELRVFEASRAKVGFHPKAYLLYATSEGAPLASYVGSSNLSEKALERNSEWNVRLRDQAFGNAARQQFEALFHHPATTVLTTEWVQAYAARRRPPSGGPNPTEPVEFAVPIPTPAERPLPHPIQQEALAALRATRETGNRAGLVVLATGLGKTFLAAFDSASSPEFSRVLFVAHRQEILMKSMETFARVRPGASMGLYTGAEKNPGADVLFASVQTLGKPRHVERFASDAFDYIVVDEFHHASAATYRSVLDHFTPRFMLGLTATPERTDGGDLLALCDENLVFSCGLGEGIRRERLAPFHYHGVPDHVDYTNIPWRKRNRRFVEEGLTQALATHRRAQNALDEVARLGGTRTLAFCVSQLHADFMRDYTREHTALRCASVHAGPTSDPRQRSLEDLESGALDMLFCVDMFNEGLDVPAIDTVLMLRPTESKLLWLQQLGRGLRKHAGKSHLTVIDYIGNHEVFLQKPAALLTALGKVLPSPRDFARILREEDYDLPPGCEVTYQTEAIAILDALFPLSKGADAIREWYEAFREQAGRRPTAVEAFHSNLNPRVIAKDYGGWFSFVRAMGDLDKDGERVLNAHHELLRELERTPMTKSYKMVLLDAMRSIGRFPGSASLEELTDAFQKRVRRSAALQREVSVPLDDDAKLAQLLRKHPVDAWTSTASADGRPFFEFSDGEFRTRAGFGADDSQFADMAGELIAWRIADYLARNDAGPVFKVLRNASGAPILKIDRKLYDLPEGDVPMVADGHQLSAKYVKEFINVVREAEGGPNLLTDLLKRWFGENAGAPGRVDQVRQRSLGDNVYEWIPVGDERSAFTPASQVMDDGGKAVDAHYSVEARDDGWTLLFESRGAGRNDEYAEGLEVLLKRLSRSQTTIARIVVESAATRSFPIEKRTAQMEQFPYPIELAGVTDFTSLRLAIGRAVATIGREPGAKGSGNTTKRLRIWVRGNWPGGHLSAALRAEG